MPYHSISEQSLESTKDYLHKRILIGTAYGQISMDYYQRQEKNDNLIFVFPVLGGEQTIESYFAKYFASEGFDTAIVYRDQDFKRPEAFPVLEDIFRNNVIRDRIAIDFFQREFEKKHFGSFGISRGAMNAAITAGVDARIRYNVLALGGTHLVEVFKKSDVRGIKKYRQKVMSEFGLSSEQFYNYLEHGILTEPANLARYLDASHTLMMLSVLDKAVPFKYGLKLREQIGEPRTVFLLSGHYTALLYTQFLKLLPPSDYLCVFPFDFIESESLAFFKHSFGELHFDFWYLPFKFVQLPIQGMSYLYYWLKG